MGGHILVREFSIAGFESGPIDLAIRIDLGSGLNAIAIVTVGFAEIIAD
jgi:hypothetical protein